MDRQIKVCNNKCIFTCHKWYLIDKLNFVIIDADQIWP